MKLKELITALQVVADQDQPEGYPPVAEWDIEIEIGEYPDNQFCYEPKVEPLYGTVTISKK